MKCAKIVFFKKLYIPQSILILFKKKKKSFGCWAPKTAVGSLLFKWLLRIWRYSHRCLVNFAYVFFCVIFIKNHVFAWGFMRKVDYGKSWKILLMLSMLQRRQNGVHQTSVSAVPNAQKAECVFNLNKIRLDAIVKNNSFSKKRSSKYVVFPRRQPYFTYGDLHSRGLENHAFQLTIL